LIKIAIDGLEGDSSDIHPALKGQSALLFSKVGNAPAKLIRALRKGKEEKPVLKAAYIDSAIFVGDSYLDSLVSLKSKEELVGEIIGLLQSPAKNVVSALKSSGGKLAGIVKTLQERG
jgi:large subunit ribosomal protein L10